VLLPYFFPILCGGLFIFDLLLGCFVPSYTTSFYLIGLFFCTLYVDRRCHVLILFLGLIQDSLTGMNYQVWTYQTLLTYIIFLAQRRYWRDAQGWVLWIVFGCLLLIDSGVHLLLCWFFYGLIPSIDVLLSLQKSCLLSFFVYPGVAWWVTWYQLEKKRSFFDA